MRVIQKNGRILFVYDNIRCRLRHEQVNQSQLIVTNMLFVNDERYNHSLKLGY